MVDSRDHKGVGEWLFKRPLEWRLGVRVVAMDPPAAFRKALRMWLPRTAVSVNAFHLVLLGNSASSRLIVDADIPRSRATNRRLAVPTNGRR
ncbi:transposase [Arthrobacter sp. ov118]|uniref:transposase n=1 Tax=Arthrobacter sp. ov118 TaxID=1761747 RepID=UPI0008E118D9|nr:transposase [Arthrobacter sp. ov118]SFT39842.1 Transposase [Arthrobacter sp. ov118]